MNKTIFNWDNILNNSEIFQNNHPFPYGFIKNPIDEEYYNELCNTYPTVDDKWYSADDYSRSSIKRHFGNSKANNIIDEDDESLSKSWNDLFHYLNSKEATEKMSEYTGLKVTKLRSLDFVLNRKGDFNLPHSHHIGIKQEDYEYKFTVLIYFAKDWIKGSPGGTYISEGEDESTIVFEPTDLNNSWICFAETPNSWHGSRYMTHDIPRPSIQFTMT